jgi:hypothetical protein
MPALFAYLLSLFVFICGGYAGLVWLTGPVPQAPQTMGMAMKARIPPGRTKSLSLTPKTPTCQISMRATLSNADNWYNNKRLDRDHDGVDDRAEGAGKGAGIGAGVGGAAGLRPASAF